MKQTIVLVRKDKKLVRAYIEQAPQGGFLAWWEDPRCPCPSMKYPVTRSIFGELVEKFRSEGMAVLVNLCGKEFRLDSRGGMIT